MSSNYEKYLRKKKIPISSGYFYTFLTLIMILVLVVSIGLAYDLGLNMPEQIAYRRELLSLKGSVSEIARDLRTVQLIKFGSIAFGSIAFAIMIWLGRSKIEYGFVFGTVWLLVYGLAFASPFYLLIKPLTIDIIMMTISLLIGILLLVWGIGLNVYRGQLKASIRHEKNSNL